MIDTKPFGRTDHRSTRAIFGAAAFWAVTQNEADAAMEQVLAYGVNHVDVASSYNLAEERLGDWIRRHGRPFFLATKTDGRTASEAREELLRSLDRLHVDCIDLWQIHNLSDPKDWETAMGPGGALEAAIAAKKEGLIRYIGITGHELCAPMLQLRALERFDFDSVMFPYSYMLAQNAQYQAAAERLLAVCRSRKTAIQIIKVIARSPLVKGEPNPYNTWYRPLDEPSEIDLAFHWVMQHEDCFLPTPADLQIFPKVLEAIGRFQSAPSDEQMREQVHRLGMEAIFS
jgi:aryl-alcohol dehydrogenase-like predicted oxidoreductase